MSNKELTPRQLGQLVQVLRRHSEQLVAERSGYAHVPTQIIELLLSEPVGGCRRCGGSLPPRAKTGRPRTLCLSCSPRKGSGKLPENGSL